MGWYEGDMHRFYLNEACDFLCMWKAEEGWKFGLGRVWSLPEYITEDNHKFKKITKIFMSCTSHVLLLGLMMKWVRYGMADCPEIRTVMGYREKKNLVLYSFEEHSYYALHFNHSFMIDKQLTQTCTLLKLEFVDAMNIYFYFYLFVLIKTFYSVQCDEVKFW